MGIQFEQVKYKYGEGSPFEILGLDDINLHINNPNFIAVLGSSGSGKSTLMQHMNSILEPTEGKIRVLDFKMEAAKKMKNKHELRKRVGLLFQFPEQQLFADTLMKDLCFGPLNFGMNEKEAKEAAIQTIQLLGLEPSILEQNSYQLSGGQLRKIAIATVLIMDPDIYVLDEPTASLDQTSRDEVMELLADLNKKGKMVIVVTHRIEEVLSFADEYLVMSMGELIFQGDADDLLEQSSVLDQAGIVLPSSIQFIRQFNQRFNTNLKASSSANQIAEAVNEVISSCEAD